MVSAWAPGSPFVLSSSIVNETLNLTTASNGENSTYLQYDQVIQNHGSYISVSLLLAGIISSRLGLWVADLSVHQIFQQLLEERNRGTISGVQTGLESFMNLVKFGLVIAFPNPDKFGFLIILSFLVKIRMIFFQKIILVLLLVSVHRRNNVSQVQDSVQKSEKFKET